MRVNGDFELELRVAVTQGASEMRVLMGTLKWI